MPSHLLLVLSLASLALNTKCIHASASPASGAELPLDLTQAFGPGSASPCEQSPCIIRAEIIVGSGPAFQAADVGECCELCKRAGPNECPYFTLSHGLCSFRTEYQPVQAADSASGAFPSGCQCPPSSASGAAELPPLATPAHDPLPTASPVPAAAPCSEACPSGTFRQAEQCQCLACSLCSPGFTADGGCSGEEDTRCRACTVCTEEGLVESAPCTPTSDRVCSAASRPHRPWYDVLGVTRDASQAEIRRVFRALSVRYHPDKNSDPAAAQRFSEINEAYEVLGNPDKRAAYDDFGKENMEGWNSFWEYQQSQSTATQDLYNGEELVTRLTEKIWDQRVTKGFWLVEFYAPWCSHCLQASPYFKRAAEMLDGEVEFGAVNCVHEQGLMQRFAIRQFPSFFLLGPELGVQVEYNFGSLHSLTEHLPQWARDVSAEWTHLHARSNVVRVADKQDFFTRILDSVDLWLVAFMGGPRCAGCSDAMANFMRMASEVIGVAQVGLVDCSVDTLRRDVCQPQGVPENYPFYTLYKHGPKPGGRLPSKGTTDQAEETGEGGEEERKMEPVQSLFWPGEIPNHLAFPLIAKVIRAALADTQASATTLAVPADEGDTFTDDRPPPPPPPPPQPQQQNYQQPPPRPVFMELPNHAASNQKYKLLN